MKKQGFLKDLNGPRYGEPFTLLGFQMKTESDRFTDLIDTEPVIMRFKTRLDYLKFKDSFGAKICNGGNASKLKSLHCIAIKYVGENTLTYL